MTSEHINPKIRCYLDASVEERVNYIRSDRFVPYARGDAFAAEVDATMLAPPGAPARSHLLIADSGMGKTTLLDYLERRYEQLSQERAMRCRFVRINLPQIVSDRRLFYVRILKRLGIPFRMADKPDFLHEQTIDALRDAETKAIAIDEFHNFLGGNIRHLGEHMVAIRDIANIPLSIIGAGTKSVESCVLADDQLEQRFTRHRLTLWEETEELRNFLATLESRIPLKLPSKLAGPDLMSLLVRLSNGHMRRMINLIKKAAEWAVTNGVERITTELVRKALLDLSGTSKYYEERSFSGEAGKQLPTGDEAIYG